MKSSSLICLFLLFPSIAHAQAYLPSDGLIFSDTAIPRIDILINTDSLAAIYLPVNANSYHEYPAIFIFSTGSIRDTIPDIGFRLRGNTSRNSAKKSFKVSFNTFQRGRKYHGLEKLNLNGEHNDPSIIRSKLCWDLYREMGVPASRSNHVRVFINGNYMGLYINVEHVDEQFVGQRYGNKNGNLFKCTWPSDLTYISNNPDDYKVNGHYELKTNLVADDYSDLAHFIEILNHTPIQDLPCALEKIFDVDVYLRALAIDIFSGNWDGPAYNKNNFYLYHNTRTGQFEYIPYDLDNTFGVDWFGIDWATRDIYQWSPGNEPRPIYDRILQVPEWKDRYSFYLNYLITSLVDTNNYFPHIDSIYNLIYTYAAADSYRVLDYGFTIADFTNSYTQALGGHVTSGLKPYIANRIQSAATQLQLNAFPPAILSEKHQHPGNTQSFPVQVSLAKSKANAADVWVIWQEASMGIDSMQLWDNGSSGDGVSQDGIYGGTIALNAGYAPVSYYFRASNTSGNTLYPCAYNLNIQRAPLPELAINEFMASNLTAFEDQSGETDDWIELVNYGSQTLNGAEFYLSDNSKYPSKWQLPNQNIAASSFPLIWADKQGSQGPWHSSFKLSGAGEFIGLYWKLGDDYIPLDTLTYGPQTADISEGRLPDGTGTWQSLTAITPGYSNMLVGLEEAVLSDISLSAFPNPIADYLNVKWQSPSAVNLLSVYNLMGVLIMQQQIDGLEGIVHLPIAHWKSGVYCLQMSTLDGTYSTEPLKIIKF